MNVLKGLISIIVPVYNVEMHLNRCIESILAQTYSNYEIILIDDDSSDSCPILCDQFAKKYPNVQTIHLKNTGFGASEARNAGLDKARGEYIAFIDSDDYVHIDLLKHLIALLESDLTVGMAACSYQKVTNTSEVKIEIKEINVKIHSVLEAMNLLLDDQNNSALWSKLFKRSIFNDLRFPEGKHNEDMFLMPFILQKAQKIAYAPLPLYYYFQDNKSLCRSAFNYNMLDMLDALLIWNEHVAFYFPSLLKKSKSHYFNAVINSCQYLANKNDMLGVEKFKLYQSKINSEFRELINSEFVPVNNKIKILLFKTRSFKFIFRLLSNFNIRKYE